LLEIQKRKEEMIQQAKQAAQNENPTTWLKPPNKKN
jgi:hypothetical protein